MTTIADSNPNTRQGAPGLPVAEAIVAQGPDLLTTLLEPCRFQSIVSRPRRWTAPWGLEADEAVPGFVLVLEGSCVLDLGDGGGTWPLQAHDMALLTRATPLRLRDGATSPAVRVTSVLQPDDDAELRGLPHRGSGALSRFLSGCFARADEYTRQMFALLPTVVVLHGQVVGFDGWFRPLVELLLAENQRSLPGGELLSNRIVQILMIQALRQASVRLPESPAGGLLAALRAPGLGAAMGAIHSQPEHDWSVHELAELAGLSRAAFAARFLETVGQPPFQYLRDVRMRLACRLLRESEKGIKEIAARVGYSTEASFSKAFTRWCGQAPGEYRRQGHRSGENAVREE